MKGVIWYARAQATPPAAGEGTLTAYTTDEFPDGAVVDASDVPKDLERAPLWRARYSLASGRLLEVATARGAASLWYVEIPEAHAEPAAVNLVAFDTADIAPGAVIDNDTFQPLEVRSDQQVGAIRWWPGTGQIHQVYVDPRRRREGIGTALIYAASAHLKASGSDRKIWAGGYRTDLGEALAHGLVHPQRVEPRVAVAPAMTPAEQAEGVPARNLRPDP